MDKGVFVLHKGGIGPSSQRCHLVPLGGAAAEQLSWVKRYPKRREKRGHVRENLGVRIDEGNGVGSGPISQKTIMGINYTLGEGP